MQLFSFIGNDGVIITSLHSAEERIAFCLYHGNLAVVAEHIAKEFRNQLYLISPSRSYMYTLQPEHRCYV